MNANVMVGATIPHQGVVITGIVGRAESEAGEEVVGKLVVSVDPEAQLVTRFLVSIASRTRAIGDRPVAVPHADVAGEGEALDGGIQVQLACGAMAAALGDLSADLFGFLGFEDAFLNERVDERGGVVCNGGGGEGTDDSERHQLYCVFVQHGVCFWC